METKSAGKKKKRLGLTRCVVGKKGCIVCTDVSESGKGGKDDGEREVLLPLMM